MKVKLLKRLRKEAYERVKINEEFYNPFFPKNSVYSIVCYNEMGVRKYVYNIKRSIFHSPPPNNREHYKIIGLCNSLHFLELARRQYVTDKMREIKYLREADEEHRLRGERIKELNKY